MNELVTAVITTYKREPEIVEQALKSILAQTYRNLEIIVVDDSPADYPLREAVAAMLDGYSQEGVRYIPHEKNMGACAARNTGLKAANGTYIGYLDDDDEWAPEKIEKMLAVYRTGGEELGLVYCHRMVIDTAKGKKLLRKVPVHRGNVLQVLLRGNFIGGTSVPLMRKSALEAIGGFDEALPAVQDYDVWVRIAENFTIDCVEEPLIVYYKHPGEQITSNPSKRIAGMERVIQKYNHYIMADKHAYWQKHLALARDYANGKQKKKALSLWLRSVKRCPLRIKQNLLYLYYILK